MDEITDETTKQINSYLSIPPIYCFLVVNFEQSVLRVVYAMIHIPDAESLIESHG